MRDFLAQAAKLLERRRQYRRHTAVFLCLAVIVAFGTVTALKLYGQAMTHTVEVLDCGYKVHEHTDGCYERDAEGNLAGEPVCGYADYAIHVHNDGCYDKDGSLACALAEHPLHNHAEECYVTEKVLVCGEETEGDTATGPEEAGSAGEEQAPVESGEGMAEETSGSENWSGSAEGTVGTEPQQTEMICGKEDHRHDETCYENVLSCGYAEEHAHTEDCFSHALICQVPEHAHAGDCYDEEGNLNCGMDEHGHEAGCYEEEGSVICNMESHTHEDGCYTSNQICGMEEHEHAEGCYAPAEAGTADTGAEGNTEIPESGAEEGGSAPEGSEGASAEHNGGHVHTDACYQEVKTLVCGEQELHTHDSACYTADCFDENGGLIEGSRPSCGLLELKEHTHTGDCFKTVELTPEEVAALNNGAKLHIHEDSCYDEEGNLVCGYDATHIHSKECYDDDGNLICDYSEDEQKEYNCGKEEHTHSEECLDEEENLICGMEEHTHDETCLEEKVYRCGKEEHVHEAECYDEEESLICETEEHTHSPECFLTEEEWEEVEKVNQLIAGLPSEEEIAQKIAEYEELGEDGEEAYREYMMALLLQIQEAYDAYLGLDEALREYVTGAEYLSALWEMMEAVGLHERPENVPEYAAFLPIGNQGGGIVMDLLYGKKQSHEEAPDGEEDYSTQKMLGYFNLYSQGIQGTTIQIDKIIMSLYFPQEFIDKESIHISEFDASFAKHEISGVAEVERESEKYYKISLTLMDYIPTAAVQFPFSMNFKAAEVPADYRLNIFGTIEVKEGEVQREASTYENVYRPKYEEPQIVKYVNTNKFENMKEDGTRVTAKLEDGVLATDQYVSFWYKLGDLNSHWQYRGYEKITLIDTLPTYVDVNGKEQIAVFDPQANPGWELSADGTTVSRVFVPIQKEDKPGEYDRNIMEQIEAAELKLRFPGCKIDEPYGDGFLIKNLKNKVMAVCDPHNPSLNEESYTCEDDIIFTLTNQPGAEGSFTKGNSAHTVMDTPGMRAGGYRWTLAFTNNDTLPVENITMEDSQIDARLKFQRIVFNNQTYQNKINLVNSLDRVEAVTYDGQTDIYDLKASNEYFKDSGYQYNPYDAWTWTLELDSTREYRSFKIYFREGFQLRASEGITVWPFSTFREPDKKQFVEGEEHDLKNIYKNYANVAYNVEGNSETIFLFSENQFKLMDTYENVWIEKNMIGDNLELPGTKKNPDGTVETDEQGNPVIDYSKSVGYCHIFVKGALRGDREYEDLRVVDLLPEALELPDGNIEHGTGGQYVRYTEVKNNYHDSGRTAVIFYLDVDKVKEMLDASDGTGYIAFTFKVRAKKNASVGQYQNYAYLLSKDFDEPSVNHGQIEDKYDLDNDGTDDPIRYDWAAGAIQSPAAIYAKKYIAKKGDNDWRTSVLRLKTGDEFQYKLSVINTADASHEHLIVYDVLPQIGDISINSKAGRESEFAVKLTGPLSMDGYDVYYTTSQEVYSKDMTSLLDSDIWIQNVTSWEEITAFKFVAKDGVKLDKGTIDFIIPVKVTENLSDESKTILSNKEVEDRDTGTAVYLEATNSFGYSTDTFKGVNMESNYVKAQISFAGFVIQKTDEKGVLLPAAEFRLEKLKESLPPIQETDSEGERTQNEGTEAQNMGDTNQNQVWDEIATGTSDGEGKVSFRNLTVGTYRLTETKAPDGYKILSDPITVTVTLDETTMEYTVTAVGLEGSGTSNNPFVVVNELFYKLPETGGIGSVLYTMAGTAFIMLGAGVLYKKKFRERRV